MTDLATIGFKADVSGLKQAERGLDSLARKGETSERRINKSVDKVNTNFMTLKSTIGLAGAALTALGSARISSEIVKQSDAWKNINSQIRQVTKSEEELISVREKLVKLSKDTRSELTNTVDLYAQLNRSTKDLGVSESELLNITKTLNNLFVAGGKPISEVSGAIRQLSQGFAAGALRGDEFNSVAEGAPKIMDALAAKLKMTRGELREFAATGGITASIMVDALRDYEEVAQRLADQTTKTFGQAMENATTNITKFVGEAEGINSVVDSLGSGIEELSENMDALVDGMQAAAAVVGVVMVGAMGKSAVATYNKVAADVAATNSSIALSNAELQGAAKKANADALKAASEQKLAVSKIQSLKTTISAIEAEAALEAVRLKAQISDIGRMKTATRMAEIQTARLALTKQLAAAELTASGATTTLAASQARAATATAALGGVQKATTVTTTALTAATRLLMGPWGLLITAVGAGAIAFANSRDKIDDVNESIKDTNKELENSISILQRLQNQTDKTRNSDVGNFGQDRLREEIGKSTRLIELYTERLEKLKSVDASFARQNMLAEKLRAEKARLEEMNKAIGGAKSGYDLLTKSAQNLIESLDPVTKKQKELERGTKLLDTALKSGAISTERYNELLVLLGNSLKETVDDPFTEMLNALEMQRLELTMSADSFEVYQLRMKAMANNLPTEQVEELVKKLKELQVIRNAKNKDTELNSLTKSVQKYGNAWSRTGSVIIDTFGDMTDKLGDYIARMEDLGERERQLAADRKKYGKDNAQIIQRETQLNFDKNMTELDGMKAISSLGSDLFKEKTAAAKVFAAIEKAIAAEQIAMSIQRMLSSNTETATVVANEGVKQGAMATTAIVNQGQGDPYTAFFRIAAMAAIMASLVKGFSGGSSKADPTQGRQESQGTGTLLGSDEKSQSILNAQERFEDIQLDQYQELRKMNDTLSSLSGNITSLATQLVVSFGKFDATSYQGQLGTIEKYQGRAKKHNEIITGSKHIFGDPLGDLVNSIIGKFNTTKRQLIDSGISIVSQTIGDIINSGLIDAQAYFDIKTTKKKFWGLSKSEKYSTEYQELDSAFVNSISLIFADISDAVLQSAEILGFETVSVLKSSLMGPLTTEDFEEFQKGIAGKFAETFEMTEMGLEEALSNFTIDIGKISLEGLSGEEIEEELQAVFSQQADLIAEFLVPSISEYQQIGEGAFDTLTRVATEQAVFNKAIESMGFNLSELSNIMQIDVAQSIITLMGGLTSFNDATAEFFNSFFSEQEQFAMLSKSLSETFASLNLEMPATREGFRALVEGLDLTTEADQKLFAILMQLVPAMDEYFDTLENGHTKVIDEAMTVLRQSINLEKERADAILQGARDAYAATIKSIEEQRKAILDAQKNAQDALNLAQIALEKSINLEKERAGEVLQVAKDAFAATMANIKAQRAAILEAQRAAEASVSASKTALSKSFNQEKERLKALSDERIASISDAAKAEQELIKLASEERINGLNDEISLLNDRKSGLASVVSDMTSLAENMRNAAGVTSSISIADALASARRGDFTQAQALSGELPSAASFTSAAEFRIAQATAKNQLVAIADLASGKATSAQRQIKALESMESSLKSAIETEKVNAENLISQSKIDAQALIDSEKANTEVQIAALDEQYNALVGIDATILSLSDAITQYQDAQLALDELNTDKLLEELNKEESDAAELLALSEKAFNEQIAALDDQYNTLLGIDTTVLSLSEAIKQYQDAQLALDALNTEELLNQLSVQEEAALALLDLAEQAYIDEMARLDAMLETAQAQIDLLNGIEENTLTAAEALEALIQAISQVQDETTSEPVTTENPVTDNEKQQQQAMMREMNKNTKKTAEILQRIELGGLDTRAIT